jgi:hypothetical protein
MELHDDRSRSSRAHPCGSRKRLVESTDVVNVQLERFFRRVVISFAGFEEFRFFDSRC